MITMVSLLLVSMGSFTWFERMGQQMMKGLTCIRGVIQTGLQTANHLSQGLKRKTLPLSITVRYVMDTEYITKSVMNFFNFFYVIVSSFVCMADTNSIVSMQLIASDTLLYYYMLVIYYFDD